MKQRDVRHATTRFGDIAYTDHGAGRPAVFVHGLFLNRLLWRHVIDRVADQRRCIAIDLPGHGATRAAAGVDLTFAGLAGMLEAFCDALGLETIDLVGNDTGGGIAQIFATRAASRLRSLTLTDCEVHDNCPPPALQTLVDASAAGRLGLLGQRMLADADFARQALSVGYEHPERLDAATLRAYLAPIFGSPERTQVFENLFAQCFRGAAHSQFVNAAPALADLHVPTLIVWGTADVFFGVKWAHWLARTIPAARQPVLLEGAKLFFPEERPEDLSRELRRFWQDVDTAVARA
jgi:pimeloyl-ACP methyl ester carboxylesterase